MRTRSGARRLAAGMLLAAAAHAQAAGACDVLKSELAARIESTGVRGYSLEAVPARTPVPAGAKVIGTCEGGAMKVLYRRWGAAQASSQGASEAKAAPAPAPTPSVARQPVARVAEAASAVPAAPAPTVEPAAAQAPVLVDRPAEATVPLAQRVTGFATQHWPWIVAALLLPLAGWLWAWHARHSAYDEAGLPRGPKL